ncbi:Histone-lysine N-methyltransferase SETMAR [Vespula squamosa]|uniref:Histone-lysine N-methyltransferase SETMAR n=1 Tax=Vespula squamosa TaxID=30214 RepID=A0ABD2ANM6_VESSQ
MEEQDARFRHILLYYFRKSKNASQTRKNLCAVYGNEALEERQDVIAARKQRFFKYRISSVIGI